MRCVDATPILLLPKLQECNLSCHPLFSVQSVDDPNGSEAKFTFALPLMLITIDCACYW